MSANDTLSVWSPPRIIISNISNKSTNTLVRYTWMSIIILVRIVAIGCSYQVLTYEGGQSCALSSNGNGCRQWISRTAQQMHMVHCVGICRQI